MSGEAGGESRAEYRRTRSLLLYADKLTTNQLVDGPCQIIRDNLRRLLGQIEDHISEREKACARAQAAPANDPKLDQLEQHWKDAYELLDEVMTATAKIATVETTRGLGLILLGAAMATWALASAISPRVLTIKLIIMLVAAGMALSGGKLLYDNHKKIKLVRDELEQAKPGFFKRFDNISEAVYNATHE